MMKRICGILLVVLGMATCARAQATSANKLAWDQVAADVATAQALTYTAYPDATATGVPLTGVVCTGGTPFTGTAVCTVPFPAFTPGNHTEAISAKNLAGESLVSAPLSFQFVIVPNIPKNLRIQ